jgi:hypothetical protein
MDMSGHLHIGLGNVTAAPFFDVVLKRPSFPSWPLCDGLGVEPFVSNLNAIVVLMPDLRFMTIRNSLLGFGNLTG